MINMHKHIYSDIEAYCKHNVFTVIFTSAIEFHKKHKQASSCNCSHI